MALANLKQTHVHPVYGGYFADPFVWKFQDTHYAIGTGALEASGETVGKICFIAKEFYLHHPI
jgi:hypothetical protein